MVQYDGNNNVGIGTSVPDAKLTVNGTVHSKEVKVDLAVPAPDYVFSPDYKVPNLDEVRNYIKLNRHLPEIPSAGQMAKEGLSLGDMNIKLLKKIEELTLYMIDMKKENEQVKQRLDQAEALLKKAGITESSTDH